MTYRYIIIHMYYMFHTYICHMWPKEDICIFCDEFETIRIGRHHVVITYSLDFHILYNYRETRK